MLKVMFVGRVHLHLIKVAGFFNESRTPDCMAHFTAKLDFRQGRCVIKLDKSTTSDAQTTSALLLGLPRCLSSSLSSPYEENDFGCLYSQLYCFSHNHSWGLEHRQTGKLRVEPKGRVNHHHGTQYASVTPFDLMLHLTLSLGPKGNLTTSPGASTHSQTKGGISDHFLAKHLRCGLSFQLLHTVLQAAQVCAGGHGLMKPSRLSTHQLHLEILSM